MNALVLAALMVAAFAPDLVDASYFVLRICSPYGLYSHSIPAVVLESAVVGALAYLTTGSRSITVLFVLVVLLHAASDYFTGRKLLLMPGGEMVGLQWYDKPLQDFALEALVLVIGWLMLRRAGQAPRLARSAWLLLAAIALQGTLDLTIVGSGRSLKPTACFHTPVGVRIAPGLTNGRS